MRTASLVAVMCCGLIGCSRAPVPRGRALVSQYGCDTCHVIPNVRSALGKVGPSLEGIGRRAYLAGRLPNTPENMVRWIRFPSQTDSETVMPDMNVSEQDALAIAEFLYALR